MSCESEECPLCDGAIVYHGIDDDGQFFFDVYACEFEWCDYREHRHRKPFANEAVVFDESTFPA